VPRFSVFALVRMRVAYEYAYVRVVHVNQYVYVRVYFCFSLFICVCVHVYMCTHSPFNADRLKTTLPYPTCQNFSSVTCSGERMDRQSRQRQKQNDKQKEHKSKEHQGRNQYQLPQHSCHRTNIKLKYAVFVLSFIN